MTQCKVALKIAHTNVAVVTEVAVVLETLVLIYLLVTKGGEKRKRNKE